MKIIYSELPPDYKTYTFPHAVYAQAEAMDDISKIYEQGFLPYSGDITNNAKLFYLCRSLRIEHKSFVDTSENRRVAKKMTQRDIDIHLIPKSEWDHSNSSYTEFFQQYIDKRFATGAMPKDRLRFILNHPLATHFLVYQDKAGKILAIIICSIHQNVLHYWFSFFDSELMDQFPIGKWVMWRTIHWSKDQGYNYTYLGTCYHPKSLYKARDFKGVQFFDGSEWNSDIKELKRRVHEDGQSFDADRWRRDNLLPEQ